HGRPARRRRRGDGGGGHRRRHQGARQRRSGRCRWVVPEDRVADAAPADVHRRLARYAVYDTDFGLGRPMKVELLSIDKTPGTVSMAEARDGRVGI
ncbi:Os02g0289500, partial [Oryza sativa Japonica Group]